MSTNCLRATPAPLVFTAEEGCVDSEAIQTLLAKNALWCSGDRSAGVSIRVLEGLLWITVEGDSRDHVLTEGNSFHTPGRERVVAQSLGGQTRMLVKQ